MRNQALNIKTLYNKKLCIIKIESTVKSFNS
jgi:hypothetical protein